MLDNTYSIYYAPVSLSSASRDSEQWSRPERGLLILCAYSCLSEHKSKQ